MQTVEVAHRNELNSTPNSIWVMTCADSSYARGRGVNRVWVAFERPQLTMARFKELNAFNLPPVTVSPIKLDTSSVPSRM